MYVQKRVQPIAHVSDYTFFEQAKRTLRNEQHLYQEFLKVLLLMNKQILSPADTLLLVEDLLLDYPEIAEGFRQFCRFPPPGSEYSDVPLALPPANEGIFSRLEIDYSACKRLGPSYRAFPREYVQPPSSGRTALCNEVINDQWISLPTGSEEGANFKSSKKNTYEESLFKCEDDRYELDILIEQNSAVLKVLQGILGRIATMNGPQLQELRMENELDVLHLRSIERIYADKCQEILTSMYQNPAVAIPCVIKRLQQKDEEWRTAREEWNKAWQVIHEKNYYKSLDHQSSSFKQRDRKALTLREFLVDLNQSKYAQRLAGVDEEHRTTMVDFPDVWDDIITVLRDVLETFHTEAYRDNEEIALFLNDFISDFFMRGDTPPPIPRKVFYGTDPFFVLLRLLETVYDRFSQIMRMSCDTLRNRVPVPIRVAVNPHHKQPAVARFESVRDVYRYYLDEMLAPLLHGGLDQTKYEEECKQLFGCASGYILTSMERVLRSIAESIEELCTSEETLRLLALYYFETNRVYHDVDNFAYRTSACDVIGDDRCYRVMFRRRLVPQGPAENILSYSLLDHPLEQPVHDLSRTKAQFKAYLHQWFTSSLSDDQVRERKVFLLRNKKNTLKKKEWNKNLCVDQRLEAKICMLTHRTFFVKNTYDYFHRPRLADETRRSLLATSDTKRRQRLARLFK